MTARKQDIALVGAGAAACAVCCAGPILGFLAAVGLGLGTVAGIVVFGVGGVAIGAIGFLVVARRRRRRSITCEPVGEQPVNLVQRR
jgi:hypothetical protein